MPSNLLMRKRKKKKETQVKKTNRNTIKYRYQPQKEAARTKVPWQRQSLKRTLFEHKKEQGLTTISARDKDSSLPGERTRHGKARQGIRRKTKVIFKAVEHGIRNVSEEERRLGSGVTGAT
jgi:hypothetical protein